MTILVSKMLEKSPERASLSTTEPPKNPQTLRKNGLFKNKQKNRRPPQQPKVWRSHRPLSTVLGTRLSLNCEAKRGWESFGLRFRLYLGHLKPSKALFLVSKKPVFGGENLCFSWFGAPLVGLKWSPLSLLQQPLVKNCELSEAPSSFKSPKMYKKFEQLEKLDK